MDYKNDLEKIFNLMEKAFEDLELKEEDRDAYRTSLLTDICEIIADKIKQANVNEICIKARKREAERHSKKYNEKVPLARRHYPHTSIIVKPDWG